MAKLATWFGEYDLEVLLAVAVAAALIRFALYFPMN